MWAAKTVVHTCFGTCRTGTQRLTLMDSLHLEFLLAASRPIILERRARIAWADGQRFDDVSELGQHTLELPQQSFGDKTVTIGLVQGSLTFPDNFRLVGTRKRWYGGAHDSCVS